jgi:hypothetical protein
MADFFDDLDAQYVNQPKKPFFELDLENDDELMTWFKEEMVYLKQDSEFRFQKIKNNYARYKGIQYRDQVYQPRDLPQKRIRYMPQMVMPLISDLVDEKTARLLEYRPTVVVIPLHDEERDKSAAKIAKRFITHVDQLENVDEKLFRLVRSSKIAGESFMFVCWDPDRGEQLTDGTPVTLPDGRVIKNPVYQGDISLTNATALSVLYEKAQSWDTTNYIFRCVWEYTDALKREYPSKAGQIKSTDMSSYYDFEKMEETSLRGQTLVVYFYHKKTKFMPDGFEAKFCGDVLLKKSALSYKHGMLPCVRLIDIENEDEQHGESLLDKVRAIAAQYNNINNTIIKQQSMCAHPKWAYEASSLDEQSLGNDISLIKLKPGSRPPTLLQPNPVSPQLFEYAATLENKFYQFGKSNSVVRGEPPPGVTAFVALQFVSESENRRISQDVSRVNNAVKQIYDMVLKTASQFYKKGEQRTMMICGTDNRWNVESYDPSDLAGPFAVQLQSTSALPDSKALRTQYVIDLGKQFPELFPREQLLEMIGLAQSEKFLDEGAAAARCAEAENEMIFDGKDAPAPEEHEMHIVHWKIHVQACQDIGFKTKTPKEIQAKLIDHILATEYLMFKQSEKSEAFGMMVKTLCPQFPMFYKMTPDPEFDPMSQMNQMKAQKQIEEANAEGLQQAMSEGFVPPAQPVVPGPGEPGFQQTKNPEQTGVSPGVDPTMMV